MKFDVVVAHYKENIDWVRRLKHNLLGNVFVYTKSEQEPDLSSMEKTCHSYLTNVGRESHTYIWHCVNRWDELKSKESSDFIFFVQGSPHGMDAENIMRWIDAVAEENLDYTYNYRMSNPYDFLNAGRCPSWAGETSSANCNVKEWCEKHVRAGMSTSLPIFWNGCFGVSVKLILESNISRYINLIQKELATINPECGHYCERLWYYIFNMDKSESKRPHNCYSFWGGSDGNRHYGTIKLREDGKIGMYHHHNETFWSASGDSITFYDDVGKPTCVLYKKNDNEYSGPFLGGGSKATHRIIRLDYDVYL